MVAQKRAPFCCRGTLTSEALCGYNSECELLLETTGIGVGTKDGHSMSALHLAASNGHLNVCKLLLDSGACLEDQDFEGSHPLHLASKGGHSETFTFLIAV
eukprot:m.140818 g.140818  ORF g.140818 m.140818 type:complete len:101 (+) comp38329_c0_seq2:739-1041(+)